MQIKAGGDFSSPAFLLSHNYLDLLLLWMVSNNIHHLKLYLRQFQE